MQCSLNCRRQLSSLKNLARECGVPRILMKRDDLTGLELSGNKIRKLEYVVAEALAQGADTLVTHGGAQSNHCRATAALAARLGLRARLILRSAEARPEKDGNLFLDHFVRCRMQFSYSRQIQQPTRRSCRRRPWNKKLAAGRKPYFLSRGSEHPAGLLGIHSLHGGVGRATRTRNALLTSIVRLRRAEPRQD